MLTTTLSLISARRKSRRLFPIHHLPHQPFLLQDHAMLERADFLSSSPCGFLRKVLSQLAVAVLQKRSVAVPDPGH